MKKEVIVSTTRLAKQILIAMIAGIIIGIVADLLQTKVARDSWVYEGAFFCGGALHVIGQLFILSMKMLVVPLILFSLVTGVSSLVNLTALCRVGAKTLSLYIFTTLVAVTLSVTLANLFAVGKGIDLALETPVVIPPALSLSQSIINLIPSNPIDAMAKGDMLQVIVFAILIGLTLALMGPKGVRLKKFFSDMNDLTLRLVMLIMKLSPYGIFALLVETFSKTGFEIIGPLAKYLLLTIFTLVIQFFLVNGTLFVAFTKLNFFHLIKKIRPALMIAFSTASSNATMPTTLTLVEKKVGVDNRIASFTIPLGTTMNMDGSAIMQGMAATFIAHAYQIELGLAGYLMIIVTTLFASIGAAGVPGTGIITLSLVLNQAGLPLEGIGLIIGIDRLIEMFRTMVNIFGDVVVTTIVAKSENQLDLKKFHQDS